MESYRITKEKLKSILQSEKTVKFLEDSSLLKYTINNSVGNANNFINNAFKDEEDIDIEISNSNNKIDDIIVFNKRIMIRAFSIKSSRFLFQSFKFREGDRVDVNKILMEVKNKINFYKYIFIILTDRNRRNQPFKVKYDYYLIPVNCFNVNDDYIKTISGINSTNWILLNNRDFYIKFTNYILEKYYIGYSYRFNC